MARKTERFSVDNETYECTQLPARKAFEIYDRLVRVVMPAIRDLLANVDGMKGKEDGAAAFLIIAGTLEKMPVGMALELADVFAGNCTHKRGELWIKLEGEVFEQHFAGRMTHLVRWLFACLRINYNDFLGGLVGSGQAVAAQ